MIIELLFFSFRTDFVFLCSSLSFLIRLAYRDQCCHISYFIARSSYLEKSKSITFNEMLLAKILAILKSDSATFRSF